MGEPFPVHAIDGAPVMAVRAEQVEDLPDGLAALGLHAPRPVVVLIGGAGGLDPADEDHLRQVLDRGVLPVVVGLHAVVVDGGTRSGVMG